MDSSKISGRLGKLVDGRYRIESVVGIGGVAVVYKAFDEQLQRNVALKVLREEAAVDAESRHQFSKEYQAVAKLSHPNIRAVYDVVSSGDMEYIVMEYVDGINLKQYMKKKGPLPWEEVLELSIQVARALSHAHSRGIIHMDIKPQNIMLPKDGTVKIADFGIAQMEEGSAPSETSEEAIGSIHYISPEQARGETVDARSDIYSLGVVMYEMLTGRLPFDGETVEDVAMQHYSVVPESPCGIDPSIPLELEDIALRAMQPEPDDRYPSADEMLAALEELRDGPVETAPAPVQERVPAARPVRDEIRVIKKDVPRISKAGELSKEGYVRRRARASKISMLLGFGLVIAFAVALFVFVWNYWLGDIFRDAERVSVPYFIGKNIDTVTSDPSLTDLYDFDIVYEADSTHDAGVITAQDPSEGASRMIVSEGIDVTLTVSSGIKLFDLPEDIVNSPFTEAQVRLQEMGLNVIVSLQASDSITENFVVTTDPVPGTPVIGGSTVTLIVSAGPQVTYSTIPDLKGLTKESALLALQREGLICTEGEITYTSSPAEESGRVMWQTPAAGTEVVSGTQVYIQVGTGPTASVTEADTEAPEPEPETDDAQQAAPPPAAE